MAVKKLKPVTGSHLLEQRLVRNLSQAEQVIADCKDSVDKSRQLLQEAREAARVARAARDRAKKFEVL